MQIYTVLLSIFLTHCILADSSTIICWTGPFVILGVLGLFLSRLRSRSETYVLLFRRRRCRRRRCRRRRRRRKLFCFRSFSRKL